MQRAERRCEQPRRRVVERERAGQRAARRVLQRVAQLDGRHRVEPRVHQRHVRVDRGAGGLLHELEHPRQPARRRRSLRHGRRRRASGRRASGRRASGRRARRHTGWSRPHSPRPRTVHQALEPQLSTRLQVPAAYGEHHPGDRRTRIHAVLHRGVPVRWCENASAECPRLRARARMVRDARLPPGPPLKAETTAAAGATPRSHRFEARPRTAVAVLSCRSEERGHWRKCGKRVEWVGSGGGVRVPGEEQLVPEVASQRLHSRTAATLRCKMHGGFAHQPRTAQRCEVALARCDEPGNVDVSGHRAMDRAKAAWSHPRKAESRRNARPREERAGGLAACEPAGCQLAQRRAYAAEHVRRAR